MLEAVGVKVQILMLEDAAAWSAIPPFVGLLWGRRAGNETHPLSCRRVNALPLQLTRRGPGRSPPRRSDANHNFAEPDMNDLIFTATVIAFFVIGGLYVRCCEKL